MKNNVALIKRELLTYSMNPMTYVASAFFLISTAIYFFYVNRFFVVDVGSSDLRFFFEFFPISAIFVVPALTMNLWRKADTEDILPISTLHLVIAKWLSSLYVIMLVTVASLALVIVVLQFGTVSFSVVICSFFGCILLFSSICAFGLFCSVIFKQSALSFFVSATCLAMFAINGIFATSNYVDNAILNDILLFFSFSNTFDAFSKGIIDSRSIAFFICTTFIFLIAAIFFVEYRKYGKRSQSMRKKHLLQIFIALCILTSLILLNTTLYYKRLDITENKVFSISEYSQNLIDSLESTLSISYYVTPELKSSYMHVRDIEDFLYEYSNYSDMIRVRVIQPNSDTKIEFLQNIGIQALDIPSIEQNKTTLLKAYSAIVIEYNNKTESIPFLLNTSTLEYDIAGRIQSLTGSLFRSAFIYIANDLTLAKDYPLLVPILENSGFSVKELDATDILQTSNLDIRTPLIVIGSSALQEEHVTAIQTFIDIGGKVFFSVSPINIDLDTWQNTYTEKSNSSIFSLLEQYGIAIQTELLNDSENLKTRLLSSTGDTLEIDYPFFINSNPNQSNKNTTLGKTFTGLSLLWASPTTLFEPATGIAQTSNNSWAEKENTVLYNQEGYSFITNPFFETTIPDNTEDLQSFSVASLYKNSIVVVSDQYFLSRALAYIDQGKAIRNFDFLINSLLWFNGNTELIHLKSKSYVDYSLNASENEIDFTKKQQNSLLFLSLWYGCFCTFPYIHMRILQKKRKKDYLGQKNEIK